MVDHHNITGSDVGLVWRRDGDDGCQQGKTIPQTKYSDKEELSIPVVDVFDQWAG